MDVIVLADRKGQELLPLTADTGLCLLPIAGKPVLEHTLEALVEAGFKQAHIVLSSHAESVKESFATGERWGILLTYSTSRGEESPLQVLASLTTKPLAPFLMVRGDVVRDRTAIKNFLELSEQIDAPCVQALCDGENGFLMLCRESNVAEFENLSWVSIQSSPYSATIGLQGMVAKLDSLAAFHQASLAAAAGRLSLLLPGMQTAIGLMQGRNSKVFPQNIKQGIAFVGAYCSLDPSVEFIGEVVINDHVIIDRRASLENTVVLPHSYIGELVELRNAIVRGNDFIRVDNGTILKISDAFLLADLTTTPINKSLGTVYNRILGLLLLVLSLPFWILAALFILWERPIKPLINYPLRGNKISLDDFGLPQRSPFNTWEIQVTSPVLRQLPRLLAVISGDIQLVGALPISLELASQRTEEWEKFADQAPAGLIGPTQLIIPSDAPEEEKLMSDSFYWANFSIRNDFRYLFMAMQMLFSRKAWFD